MDSGWQMLIRDAEALRLRCKPQTLRLKHTGQLTEQFISLPRQHGQKDPATDHHDGRPTVRPIGHVRQDQV